MTKLGVEAIERRQQVVDSPWAGDPERRIEVTVWQPAVPSRGLVLYSHGQHGSAGEVRDLAPALAAAGFTFAVPEHRDQEAEAAWVAARPSRPDGFEHAARAYRAADLRHTLDVEGATGQPVVVLGFSLGAHAALALAGLLPEEQEPRLDGLMLLAPAVFMFAGEELAKVEVPTLTLFGEDDRRAMRGGVGDRAQAQQLARHLGDHGEWVELVGEGHLAFVRRRPLRDLWPGARAVRRSVAREIVCFLERLILGQPGEVADDPRILWRSRGS